MASQHTVPIMIWQITVASVFFLLVSITFFHWHQEQYWNEYIHSISSFEPPNSFQSVGNLTRHVDEASLDQQTKLPVRILYTVTTLHEYDDGTRATETRGDRLQGTLIPAIRQGVESMLSFGYDVDVYVIAHYQMLPERFDLIRQALPESVSLQVWDDATPLSYDYWEILKRKTTKLPISLNFYALARQHRFVVKDNLWKYDVFLNFEDDMIIKGEHVRSYLQVSYGLEQLRLQAQDRIVAERTPKFYGNMTKWQLERLVPGLIRVEVLLNESEYGAQGLLDPVPLTSRPLIDPQPCCHVSNQTSSLQRPASPLSDQMFLWETNIVSLGVRQLPDGAWVLMQRGPSYFAANETISDYWSGRDGYFSNNVKRPHAIDPNHVGNQGGWMATRQQILNWHAAICTGGFLPPFNKPNFQSDGLYGRYLSVEYWSGSLQLFTNFRGCNLQRIIPLDPVVFSRHLAYHSSNNKQRQLRFWRHRFVKVNDFFGQLTTVKKNAERQFNREQNDTRGDNSLSAYLRH